MLSEILCVCMYMKAAELLVPLDVDMEVYLFTGCCAVLG